MPNKFRKLSQAEDDLDSIWGYIAADNVRAADRLVERIGKVFEMLVQTPLAGRERPELRQGLRSFARSDGVEIVRVLNGRQDISAEDLA